MHRSVGIAATVRFSALNAPYGIPLHLVPRTRLLAAFALEEALRLSTLRAPGAFLEIRRSRDDGPNPVRSRLGHKVRRGDAPFLRQFLDCRGDLIWHFDGERGFDRLGSLPHVSPGVMMPIPKRRAAVLNVSTSKVTMASAPPLIAASRTISSSASPSCGRHE